MHEVSLVQALFDQADRAIGAHAPGTVRRVTVRIGEHAGVERVLFETAFRFCRDERGYAAAELAVVEQPGGDGIFLDRLELEVPDV